VSVKDADPTVAEHVGRSALGVIGAMQVRRDTIVSALALAVFVACLPILAFFVLWKLPQVLCERCRAVRFFLPLCAVYYPAVVAFGVEVLRLPSVAAVAIAVAGFLHSVPAGPFAFLVSKRKRRAALAAIRYHEQSGEFACYQHTRILAVDAERCLVSVSLAAGRGVGALVYAVSADGQNVAPVRHSATTSSVNG
jgi:hypothetical protein